MKQNKNKIAQNTGSSNFKHYIDEIKNGNDFFTLEMKFRVIANMLAIVHAIMGIIFYFVPLYPLMLFNGVSVFYYLIIVKNLIKKGSYPSAMITMVLEIIVYSFFATICTGTATGFSFYDVALVTAFFYLTFVVDSFQKKEFIPFVFSLMTCFCYMFNYITMMFIVPVYTVSQFWINLLYLLNSIICFSAMIIFSFMLVWEIKLSNHRLAVQNEQLDEIAHKDPLTKLYNRRSMNKFLNESMDNLKLRGKRFSLILGDIDDFKKVNDTYGHDAGDLVLKAVAGIISEDIRSNDYVCRWGGEEILILVNDPVETASMSAERIRKHIEDSPVVYDNQTIKITMTFGVSESIPGYRIEHLIQQADNKLYEGKKAGKNQVVI